MTNIEITHNPFSVKTEMIIDGKNIEETSGLYKYVNTPMHDWVDEFLPMLIGHCNDDELNITFKGLQYNYEDLELVLEAFLKKYRYYDINLEYDPSKSQVARLGAVESVINEIKAQTIVEELKDEEFLSEIDNRFNVVVIGGTDKIRYDFVDELLSDRGERKEEQIGYCYIDKGYKNSAVDLEREDTFKICKRNIDFITNKYSNMKIYELPNLERCENYYYRFAKNNITLSQNSIIIYILEENLIDNNTEMLNLISEQYKIKGKQNKWRFLFVAENQLDAKKMLKREFAIRALNVYGLDDISSIRKSIGKYHNEVNLVKQVKENCNTLLNGLRRIEGVVHVLAEQNKKYEEINKLEEKALDDLKNLKVSCKYSFDKFNRKRFIKNIEKEFAESCFNSKGNPLNNSILAQISKMIVSEEARKRVKDFIKKLPLKIERQLKDKEKSFNYKIIVNGDSRLQSSLKELECLEGIDLLCDMQSKINIRHKEKDLTFEYLTILRNKRIFLKEYGGLGMYDHFRMIRGAIKPTEYLYFEGIEKLLCSKIYGEGFLESSTVEACKDIFRRELDIVREIFDLHFEECISRGDRSVKYIEKHIEDNKDKLIECINLKAHNLRKEAEISEVEKQKLEYIKKIQKRVEELICL